VWPFDTPATEKVGIRVLKKIREPGFFPDFILPKTVNQHAVARGYPFHGPKDSSRSLAKTKKTIEKGFDDLKTIPASV